MSKFNGSTFSSIIQLDSAVEKLVGEEVNSMKEVSPTTYKFSTDNFIVEVVTEENLYSGITVLAHDIVSK